MGEGKKGIFPGPHLLLANPCPEGIQGFLPVQNPLSGKERRDSHKILRQKYRHQIHDLAVFRRNRSYALLNDIAHIGSDIIGRAMVLYCIDSFRDKKCIAFRFVE